MIANMFILFILIPRVSCEWIEITQQYYRKPVKPTNQYTLTTEITREKEVYTNHSITEHQWNKRPNNSPASLDWLGTDRQTEPTDMDSLNKGHPIKNGKVSTDSEQTKVTGNVKGFSHIGKVDRVQLTNTSLKSSAVKLESELTRNKENIFKKDFESPFRITSYNDFEIEHKISMEATTETVFNYHKNLYETNYNKYNSKHELKNYTVLKHKPLLTDVESFEQTLNVNRFHKIPEIQSQNADEISIKTGRVPISDISSQNSKVVATINSADNYQLKTNQKTENNKGQFDINTQYIKTGTTEKEYDVKSTKDTSLPNDEKPNALEAIVKFVKLVSETISSNTRKGFNSKVRYLEDLKNNLIANIEERIETTWPDNYDTRDRRRRSRAIEGSARGHIEFPSSETTLMSISFLTFAVFLIKLVLQVIQTYKNKSMMVAPLVVATAGRAALPFNHP